MASVGRNGTILTVCARAETTPFFIAIVCIFMNFLHAHAHAHVHAHDMCMLQGRLHYFKMCGVPFAQDARYRTAIGF